MPRLVGKKNNSALYGGLGLLVIGLGCVALEYFGVVDFIPNFGKEIKTQDASISQPVKTNRSSN
ncbi:hypothetical protein HCU40_17685 [Pseudanabaena biceps]|nr:hypothetical protein [Pseudanabaena biceps]